MIALTKTDALENFLEFLYVMIIFIAVLAIAYFVTRWIGKLQKKQYGTGSNLELLEACRLSTNKYMQIVRAGKKYFVLAVCKDTVTVIGELSEDELEATRKNGNEKPFASFHDILDKMRGTGNKDDMDGNGN
ncbi:MAG: hypothetical protein E7261_08820 [Lachnospiraceae bacterium]|nr:hypothetical protein [Lachnospiraceae bacterium]